MFIKEFSKGDVFRNTLITNPKYNFKIFNGQIYSKNYVDGSVVLIDLLIDLLPKTQGILDFSTEDNSGLISLI